MSENTEEKKKNEPETSDRDSGQKGSAIGGLLSFLVFLAVLFVAGEVYLRYFAPQHIVPKSANSMSTTSLNSLGLHDTEFAMEKPEGERRVLVLGSSAVFGENVAIEETFSKKLQASLDEPWFVINGGREDASLESVISFLTARGLSLQPELVVLALSPDMLAPANPDTQTEKAVSAEQQAEELLRKGLVEVKKSFKDSFVYKTAAHYITPYLPESFKAQDEAPADLKKLYYAYGYDVEGINIEEVNASYEALFREISLLQQILSSSNINLMIAGLPSAAKFEQPEKIRISPVERMEFAARTMNIPFINMEKALETTENAFAQDSLTKLNEKGHEAVATELTEVFAAPPPSTNTLPPEIMEQLLRNAQPPAAVPETSVEAPPAETPVDTNTQ